MKKERAPSDWREYRRMRAWELHQQGWTQKAIAAALGVTKGAVSQWMSRATTEGLPGLYRHPAPGPSPRLSQEQTQHLTTVLEQGAEAFGYAGQQWTTKRVADVIQRQYGVKYHPAHCSRILRAIRQSVQKPVVRASQRDEAAIKHWQTETWLALKKSE